MHSGTRSMTAIGRDLSTRPGALGPAAAPPGELRTLSLDPPQKDPPPAPPRSSPGLLARSEALASPGHVTPEQTLFNHFPHLNGSSAESASVKRRGW